MADPARKKIQQLDVMVSRVITETHDAVTLELFTGNEHLTYKPGHFLTIDPHQFPALERFIAYLEHIKGRKEPARAYSLASAPHENYISITVKEERYEAGKTPYPPLLSPLLVSQIPAGTRMKVTGFTGPFTLPDDIGERTDHVLHVAAGSGAVPNFSMIKHILETTDNVRQTLVYSNKTWADVIYKRSLASLTALHPQRLQVIHALTRQEEHIDPGEKIHRGRIDADLLTKAVGDTDAVEVFVCGPGVTPADKKAAKEAGTAPKPRFLESAVALLKEVGVAPEKIHTESYG